MICLMLPNLLFMLKRLILGGHTVRIRWLAARAKHTSPGRSLLGAKRASSNDHKKPALVQWKLRPFALGVDVRRNQRDLSAQADAARN